MVEGGNKEQDACSVEGKAGKRREKRACTSAGALGAGAEGVSQG